MTQLNDKCFKCLTAPKVLRAEIVDSKLNTQSVEGSERNARDAMHVIVSQPGGQGERRGDKTLDQTTGYR